MEQSLYSIGHSNLDKEIFLCLLQQYSITYLIDVRSQPYSKYNPQYNRELLRPFLMENRVQYIFMGDTLGGRPENSSCYHKNGLVDYEKIKQQDFFIRGINRLKTANEKKISAVIMCSEGNPGHCHRSRLIGKVLLNNGIILQHICSDGTLKDQWLVQLEINKGFPEGNLFDQ